MSSGSTIYAITDENSELQQLLTKQHGCVVSNSWDTQKNVDLLSSLVKQSPKKYDRSNKLDLYQRDFLAKVISNMIKES